MYVFIGVYIYLVADQLFRNAINQTDDFNSTLSDLDSAVGSWRSRYIARHISFKTVTGSFPYAQDPTRLEEKFVFRLLTFEGTQLYAIPYQFRGRLPIRERTAIPFVSGGSLPPAQ